MSGNSDKIKFHCKNCGQGMGVPQAYAGKKGKCPKCKNLVLVPCIKRESSEDTRIIGLETKHEDANSRQSSTRKPKARITDDEEEFRADLVWIAKLQRFVMYSILIVLVLAVWAAVSSSKWPLTVGGIVDIGICIMVIVLMKAMRGSRPQIVIYAIGLLIPFVNLLVLWEVSRWSTRVLRRAGYHVGLLGVKSKDLP